MDYTLKLRVRINPSIPKLLLKVFLPQEQEIIPGRNGFRSQSWSFLFEGCSVAWREGSGLHFIGRQPALKRQAKEAGSDLKITFHEQCEAYHGRNAYPTFQGLQLSTAHF